MSLYFEHPWALALLSAAGVIVWVNRGSLADQGRIAKALVPALGCGVVVLLSLALAVPHVELASKRLSVAVLVDVSASGAGEDVRSALAFARDLRRRLGSAQVDVVVFAREAEHLEEIAEDPPAIRKSESEATDIAKAIRVALASFPAGHVGRIVLCSDGLANVGNPLEAARGAAGRNVPLLIKPYSGSSAPEVLVSKIELPRDVQPGSSIRVKVCVVSSDRAEASLDLFRNKWKLQSRRVDLTPGENTFDFELQVPEAAFLEVSALVSSRSDTYADNNYARAIAPARRRPRILYLERDERRGRYLHRALSLGKLDVDLRTGVGFPGSLAGLAGYDLVILSDVPRHELPEKALDLLEIYVRDLGGGLLTLGGESAYGLGGYAETPLARMLPVEMESRTRRDVPSLALVLAIDKSGSMARRKLELAKSAAIASAELLTRDDYLGVVSFDSAAYKLCPITTAADRDGIVENIRRLQSGGGTNIYPALELARSELLSVAARLKHVILLSDGKSGGVGHEDLVACMSADRITVSTVAVGQGSDRELLRRIAGAGRGRYYFTDDPGSVPRIFVKETLAAQRSAILEEPFVPNVTVVAEVLAGIPWEEAPPLYGYVAVSPKPLGEVLLASDRADPVLARWRYGIGKVACYMSDVTNRWAADWVEWPYFRTLFSQLARETMRADPDMGRASVSLRLDADAARIVADLTDDRGAFVNKAEVQATVVRPTLDVSRVSLSQTAPGRYEGAFDSREAGAYLVRVGFRDAGRELASVQSGIARGYPDEYSAFGRDEALLEALARESSGAFISTVDDALAPDDRTATSDFDLSGTLLAGAMALFLADILARRLQFGR